MKYFLYSVGLLFSAFNMLIYSQTGFSQGVGRWVEISTSDLPFSGNCLYNWEGDYIV